MEYVQGAQPVVYAQPVVAVPKNGNQALPQQQQQLQPQVNEESMERSSNLFSQV